ncbi:MAG: hypothetical protein L0H70_00910 [Xanthomonadales bacterium]|nr:hypothetical protein [Xanthomonadales bacterium]
MKPLKIALCGMDEQQASGFAKTFDSLSRRLGRAWLWGGDAYESADLVVIDIDTVYGHIDWLKATAMGLRTVLYTVADNANESDLILHKPLKTAELADVLMAVAAEHGMDVTMGPPDPELPPKPRRPPAASTVDGAMPAPAEIPAPVTPPSAATDAPVAANKPALAAVAAAEPALPVSKQTAKTEVVNAPAITSVGGWLLAQHSDKPVAIRAHEHEWVIDVERDAYHGPSALKPLHIALKQPPDVLHPITVEALEQSRKQPSQPLGRLRWYAAMCATPGKLASGLDPEAQYKLSRWPQIEREFPRHFRIATAMMKQADRIDDVASASGAPREDVIDFINAYSALGYIAVDGANDEAARGVMSRLRNPFAR